MDDTIEKRLQDAVAGLQAAGAREVYLFGSYVEGRARPDSDIDLAVSGLPPEKFYRAFHDVMQTLHCPLDLVDLDEDNLFTQHLKTSGELVRVG